MDDDHYAIAGIVGLVLVALVGFIILSPSIKDQDPSVAAAFTPVIPDATNYAVDTTGTLTTDQLSQLNARLKAISDNGKQIAVLLVNTTAPDDIEQYGIEVADKWKVGYAGKDNGVILIIAVQDRKLRIEVGAGAEADITDSDAGNIIRDDITPSLKSGDWIGGINVGVNAISSKLK